MSTLMHGKINIFCYAKKTHLFIAFWVLNEQSYRNFSIHCKKLTEILWIDVFSRFPRSFVLSIIFALCLTRTYEMIIYILFLQLKFFSCISNTIFSFSICSVLVIEEIDLFHLSYFYWYSFYFFRACRHTKRIKVQYPSLNNLIMPFIMPLS